MPGPAEGTENTVVGEGTIVETSVSGGVTRAEDSPPSLPFRTGQGIEDDKIRTLSEAERGRRQASRAKGGACAEVWQCDTGAGRA